MTNQPIKLCKDCKHYVHGVSPYSPDCSFGEVDYINGGRLGRFAQKARENPTSCGSRANDFHPVRRLAPADALRLLDDLGDAVVDRSRAMNFLLAARL